MVTTPRPSSLEQLQELRGGASAGAAADAPSTPEHPPQHGADAGAFEGMMDYLAPRAAGEPPPRVQPPSAKNDEDIADHLGHVQICTDALRTPFPPPTTLSSRGP